MVCQALRPAGEVHYKFNNRWSADADFSLSRGEGFHAYDNVQNSFFISYTKPIRRSVEDVGGPFSSSIHCGSPSELKLRIITISLATDRALSTRWCV